MSPSKAFVSPTSSNLGKLDEPKRSAKVAVPS